jgi:hypothetical protein
MSESEVLALIKRLEAVTARLEKLERQVQSGAGTSSTSSASSAPSTAGESSGSVREFDDLVNTSLKAYFDAAAKLGGEVHEQVLHFSFHSKISLVQRSFNSCCSFLIFLSSSSLFITKHNTLVTL